MTRALHLLEIASANAVEGPPTLTWLATHSVSVSIFLQGVEPVVVASVAGVLLVAFGPHVRAWI